MNNTTYGVAAQSSNHKPYKKRVRFSFGSRLINNPNDMLRVKNELEWERWGFSFSAPICKAANSWRSFHIKAFGKIFYIRWTLPHIYWG